MAAITHIHVHLVHRSTDHPFHLLHLCPQRVAVIGTSLKALCSDEPSAATADCHADLVAKLVRLARFALGDASHCGLMHAVDLVLVVSLLGMDVARRTCRSTWRNTRSTASASAAMSITLLDRQALGACRLHQSFAHAVVEPRIGRETNHLGLHRCIYVDFKSMGRTARMCMPESIVARSIPPTAVRRTEMAGSDWPQVDYKKIFCSLRGAC